MHTVPCPHCGADVKQTATYCLACDTPLVDTDRGLSVADPTPVTPRAGSRTIAFAGVAALLVVAGGVTFGAMHLVGAHHRRTEASAADAVRRGATLLTRAEAGDAAACRSLGAYVAGPDRDADCERLVGTDPGARLEDVRVGTARLVGESGTVRLRATVVDHHGRRELDHVFDLVEHSRQWRLAWDGSPPV